MLQYAAAAAALVNRPLQQHAAGGQQLPKVVGLAWVGCAGWAGSTFCSCVARVA